MEGLKQILERSTLVSPDKDLGRHPGNEVRVLETDDFTWG
jgi:hypothetical protein